MGDNKKTCQDKHSPDTALTLEVDLSHEWLADTQAMTISDFEAVTEQVSLSPDTESTIEIDLPKRP